MATIIGETGLRIYLKKWSPLCNIIFTTGCFDLFHVGHAYALKAAKKADPNGKFIVGINSDESVRKLKGPGRPIICESERKEMVSNMPCVDVVIMFNEQTAEKLVEIIRPNIMAKGAEYSDVMFPERVLVESYGGKMHFIPMRDGISTSEICAKIITPNGK